MKAVFNEQFCDYKTWCSNQGTKPHKADTLFEYVEQLESGDIIKCDCCGDMTERQFTNRARYDHDKRVCEQCRRDGC